MLSQERCRGQRFAARWALVLSWATASGVGARSSDLAAVGARPPMGFNPWNELARHYAPWANGLNETIMEDVANAMVRLGLRDAGYTYVSLDCGYSAGASNSGKPLEVDTARFPSGLTALSRKITSLGLQFGIYSSGKSCCDGNVRLGMEKADARQFAEWNVTYVKYDDCGTTTQSFIAMRDALRATGTPIFYSIHSPWTHHPTSGSKYGPDPQDSVAIANCWRTTNDIKNDFGTVMDRAHTNNQFAHLAGHGHFNDPDMLEVGNGLTDAEGRSHFALWCLMKAPLLIGTDVTRATAATLATLSSRGAIAVNQDALAVQGTLVKGDASWELWAGPLSGGCVAVVVVNLGNTTLTRAVTWQDVGLPAGVAVVATDVYANHTLPGRPSGLINVSVATEHDCAFLTLCPAPPHPPHPTRPFLRPPRGQAHAVAKPRATAPQQATPCTSALSCSLNGECGADGTCRCDPGWINGAAGACELLDLAPADLSQGYNHLRPGNASISSWGATQLRGDDGLYHTFVGEITLGCGINGYETNEQVVHATSVTPLGPWKRDGPVKPFGSSAVCPHAQRAPDGRYLIFHTGCGNHSDPNSEGYGTNHSLPINNCVNGTTPSNPHFGPGPSHALGRSRGAERSAVRALPASSSSSPPPPPPATCGVASDVTSVFVSRSPYGPWTQTRLRTNGAPATRINGVAWPGCVSAHDPKLCKVPDNLGGNPTAVILKNGTTLVLFRTYYSNVTQCRLLGAVLRPGNGYPGCTLVGLARAVSWDGEYEILGGPIVPFQQEDPFVFQTRRGFHAVFHGMDPWPSVHAGRHAYSEDGVTWHGGDVDAWNNTVELADGTTIELARRERPELVRDADGRPVALISGAQFGAVPGNPGDQTFTLVQPVKRS